MLWGGPGLQGPLCRELRVRGLPVSSSQTPVACSTDHELVVPPPPPPPGPRDQSPARVQSSGAAWRCCPGTLRVSKACRGSTWGASAPVHTWIRRWGPHTPPVPAHVPQVTAAFPAWPSGMNTCLFPGELERWVYRGSPYTAAEVRGPVHTWPGKVAAGLSAHRLAQLVLVGP